MITYFIGLGLVWLVMGAYCTWRRNVTVGHLIGTLFASVFSWGGLLFVVTILALCFWEEFDYEISKFFKKDIL